MIQSDPIRSNQKLSECLYTKWQPVKAINSFIKLFALADSNAKKQAILNRLKDYFLVKKQLPLHYKVAKILEEQEKNYDPYDYGESYFYQSCKPLHITGFRNTEARINCFLKKNEEIMGTYRYLMGVCFLCT